jgi:iron complex outermembrane recepter protein
MKNFTHVGLAKRKLAWSIAAAIAVNTYTATVVSAAEEEASELEEVVITGSRIVRRDYQSNSPIVTVDAGDFETQTGLNVESYLNQLPTYNPAAAPTTAQGDVQITPVNSVGIASISLRGFGPNRSLVLVNGKRPTPINALMVTDVNGIPSALVQRVETITGGASAVYGADAVGGVTNFILRDNFEGLEIDTQHGMTEAGDGDESRISAVVGANLADGRGNVTFGAEYYNREEALEVERDIFTDRYSDPYAAGGLFLQGTSHYNTGFGNQPNANAVNALFPGRPAGSAVLSPFAAVLTNYNFNADGTVWIPGSEAGLTKYKTNPNWTFYPTQAFDASVPGNTKVIKGLKWHNTKALASAPQERYSFFSSGNFDITDSVELFARGTFAESETRTQLFGTNAIFGWEGSVPYNPSVDSPVNPNLDYNDPAVLAAILANPAANANPGFIATGKAGAQHPVPLELAMLLNSRSNKAADWIPGWNPDSGLPPRSTINTNTVWQVETGLNFDLPVKDWTGEVYFSHGQSSTYNNAAGNLSLSRYRDLIRRPDYGRNLTLSGNANGASPGFGAADITCKSGFYDTYFGGDKPLSQDCFNAVNATLQTRAQNTQDIIELNVQGGLFELPAGEVRAAAGYQKRRNGSTFVPDILQSTYSFTDQVVGVYPTGYLDGATSVDDYYAEALVPVVSDLPAIQNLELELGVRYSDYAQSDAETTWKTLVNWEVNDWVRLRGGFNRATRAPNIGELFLNQQEIFQVGGNNFGDPCGLRSAAPYGAGGTGLDPNLTATEIQPVIAPGQTNAGAQSTRLICEVMMGATGSNQFYKVADASGGAGGAFNWNQQVGNPNLQSETADTWTFGVVASSPFDSAWLSGLTLSLDWYKVEIEDAIMLYSVDYANYRCFGSNIVANATEAAAQAASDACKLVPRNSATGGVLTTSLSYDNQATIKTSGMDIALNWSAQLGELGLNVPGGIGASLKATWLDYYRTKQSPAVYDVETDWAGSLGPNLQGTNGGAYDYRLFGDVSYFKDDWSVSLRWRHLPSVWSAGYASLQAIQQNNASVKAGGAGILLGYTPTTEIETDSYNIFDMSANWNINETVAVRGGITNLFDEEPAEVASTAGFPVGTNLAGICNGAPGCQAPTSFSLPSTGGFNGGYYDTLGRRWFMGIKMTF